MSHTTKSFLKYYVSGNITLIEMFQLIVKSYHCKIFRINTHNVDETNFRFYLITVLIFPSFSSGVKSQQPKIRTR